MLNHLKEFGKESFLRFALFSIMVFLSKDETPARALLLFPLFDEAVFFPFVGFPGPLLFSLFASIARAHLI